LKQYLPWLGDAEYRAQADSDNPYSQPVGALRRILIDTRVYANLGLDLLARDHPDLAVAYFEGTHTIGHIFAPFPPPRPPLAPPREPEVSQPDSDRYHQVPERYFHEIDERLGDFRRIAEATHATLMLASDHGFSWKEGRPLTVSSNATTTAAKWHRDEGMY